MTSIDQATRVPLGQKRQIARRTIVAAEILKLAVGSFQASKMRFALTALGMVIGTASVILVVTIGLTGKQYVLQELQKIELNSIELEYAAGGPAGSDEVRYDDFLTREDERAVLARLPGVVYSSPVLEIHDHITFPGGLVKDTLILGVSTQYRNVRNLLVPQGRFFDDVDETAHMRCAVVTETFARQSFGSADAALGQTFTIHGIPFTVIGVFKESVDDFGQSEIVDETILIPYSVGRFFTGTDAIEQIYFSLRNMQEVPDAAPEIVRIVQARHRPGSIYKAQTLTEMLSLARTVTDALTAVLVLVSTVTLVAGGIGIMNIMLANVRSRVHEIGIRKALGATYREIKFQFLAESVLISLAGGVVGTVVGIAVPLSIQFFTGYALPVSAWSVVIALAAATLVGVVFGTVPATRAAQLDPVEALRFE